MSDSESGGLNKKKELYDKKWVCEVFFFKKNYESLIFQYAKSNRAKCKDTKCLLKHDEDPKSAVIEKGSLKIGRRYPSPFNEEEILVNWFHLACFFSSQTRARKDTKLLEDPVRNYS